MSLFLSPYFDATLQRAQKEIGIFLRVFRLQPRQQFPARLPRPSSNQPRSSWVTPANGSGRRRSRFCFGFGFPVGRISPSLHAVRKPERNSSSAGSDTAESDVGNRSAEATRRCCAARMSLSIRIQLRSHLRQLRANRRRRQRMFHQALAGCRRKVIALAHPGAAWRDRRR